ncbi:50S ribosomal protein L11 methyltransferase [Micromonospora sp. DT231]|uniref:50S ribosomal protein L11 methyltransferase n=1 Tax=Micromonospora sp. DT231 TaxID=3416526 RepID=UPI003CE98D29
MSNAGSGADRAPGTTAVDPMEDLVIRGRAAMVRRDYHQAVDLFALAQALSGEWNAAPSRQLNRALRQIVPRWHFSMMNDAARNAAYADAIASVVGPGKLVLDIGTGSGLLALLSARAGADYVVSCEAEPVVAAVARQIVAENGYEERIAVLAKPSTDLVVGTDLPARADVLVTEIFDCALLGEGVLPTMEHARREMLAPGGTILPYGARLWGMLVESRELYGRNHVGEVCDFDLSAFEQFRSLEYFSTYLDGYRHRRLTEPFPIADFDFGDEVVTDSYQVSTPISRGGIGHAVIMWFELYLCPGISLSNGPDQPGSHWRQAVQTLPSPVEYAAGDRIDLTATHDGERVLVAVDRSSSGDGMCRRRA